ncbi:UDP-N-acetylglucosamine--LPS N-acetylglucosamine transferase [Microbacterium sp. NPDC016588]
MTTTVRVLFVCSSGGHLDQMLALLPAPEGADVAIATFLKPDALAKVAGFRTYGLYWPTNRSLKALVINTVRAFRILNEERPDIIVSSGAAAAVAFFFVGKLFHRTRNVFIECFDRIDNATLTARLVRPVADLYICQWESQLVAYPHREQVTRSR